MARLFVSGAMLAAMLGGADAHVRFAADYSVQPYLDNRSLGVRHGAPVNVPSRPGYGAPVSHPPVYRPALPRVPEPAIPLPRHELASPPPPKVVVPKPLVAPQPPAMAAPNRPAPIAPIPDKRTVQLPGSSPLYPFLLVILTLGCAAASALRGKPAMSAADSGETTRGRGSAGNASGPVRSAAAATMRPAGASVQPAKSGFPAQEGWTRRASNVRNPVSGFFFRFGARANARALEEEQKRMKTARGVIQEHAGMYADLLTGEQAATAYGVRKDLAVEHYEHEREKQQEVFDEAAHTRRLGKKRREKELTEADTRHIEAQHEQEATVRFKEPKFAAGLARFEEKQKGYEVGAASAEAAIAESKAPAPPSGANESQEVVQLYELLQSTMAAIEEGERLGRDTQALRERADLYKKLLRL